MENVLAVALIIPPADKRFKPWIALGVTVLTGKAGAKGQGGRPMIRVRVQSVIPFKGDAATLATGGHA